MRTVLAIAIAALLGGCATTDLNGSKQVTAEPLVAEPITAIGVLFYYTEEEIDLLARTLWGEARGQSDSEMEAISNVVVNRLMEGKWGDNIRDVIMFPLAFSCHNKWDKNRRKLQRVDNSDSNFVRAVRVARHVLEGRSSLKLEDNSNGATHYHAWYVRPTWADKTKIVAKFYAHVFYSGVRDYKWEITENENGAYKRDLKPPKRFTSRHRYRKFVGGGENRVQRRGTNSSRKGNKSQPGRAVARK